LCDGAGMFIVKDSKLIGYCRGLHRPADRPPTRRLEEASCGRLFQEEVSSRVRDRTGLFAALDHRLKLCTGIGVARVDGAGGGSAGVEVCPERVG